MLFNYSISFRIAPFLQSLTLILLVFTISCSETEKKSNRHKPDEGRLIDYTHTLHFLTSSGDTISTIKAGVARTREQQNMGLMDVQQLPDDRGMLFIFDREQPRSFWMANTPLPLDIIFVNERREIVRIHRNAQPYSNERYSSGEPAKYVVETNAGYCVSNDIREGMKISFSEIDG